MMLALGDVIPAEQAEAPWLQAVLKGLRCGMVRV